MGTWTKVLPTLFEQLPIDNQNLRKRALPATEIAGNVACAQGREKRYALLFRLYRARDNCMSVAGHLQIECPSGRFPATLAG